MGTSMASRLLQAGYSVKVFTRTASKASALLDKGAAWAESPAAAAKGADVVCTMVGYPADVEEVYLGAEGIFTSATPGQLLIDFTTSSPELARRVAEAGARQGLDVLDAPVSGGDIGAREGKLSIMVGGTRKAFDRALPLFQHLGTTCLYQGAAGSGQYCKMANQIAIASGMLGVCESLTYMRKAGLDPSTALASIRSGAAGSWSLSNLAPRMLKGDFAPGFYIRHFLKDLRIAIDSARQVGCDLPGLELAETLYSELERAGTSDLGTQALILRYLDPQV